MKKILVIVCLGVFPCMVHAQSATASAKAVMTPELLWKLGRITGLGVSKDGTHVLYTVSTPDAETNKSKRDTFMVPVTSGAPVAITKADSLLLNKNLSPDGKYILSNKEVLVKKIKGTDIYADLP